MILSPFPLTYFPLLLWEKVGVRGPLYSSGHYDTRPHGIVNNTWALDPVILPGQCGLNVSGKNDLRISTARNLTGDAD